MTTKDKIAQLQIRLAYIKESNRFDANHKTEFTDWALGGSECEAWEQQMVEGMKSIAIKAHQKEIERLEHLQFDEG